MGFGGLEICEVAWALVGFGGVSAGSSDFW